VIRLTVIGGGLAGCEAAWQAARCGVEVDLYEMRPQRSGPAHKTDRLAELVCSNSLRGASLENAVGLLKEELARLDSVIVTSARAAAVPAGGALAVDRERFAALVESRIAGEPGIHLHREEVRAIPGDRPAIVACGPLPGEALLDSIVEFVSAAGPPAGSLLHYYDAASPIVAADSVDESVMYWKSRYDKGGDPSTGSGQGDYLNIPLDREQYARLVRDLRTLERHPPKDFEVPLDSAQSDKGDAKYFEGCLPIEEMADRGDDVLRFGPLKPVGLRDPRTGKTPHAVVQLRKENAEATAYNLVGFQTRLSWPAQREAFGRLPGLERAEWLRLGVVHRNAFIDSPRLLDARLKLRSSRATYFAGQITGAEGYVEAAACGAMAGVHAARAMLGLAPIDVPRESALGAVVAHLLNTQTPDFQPANVTWAYFPPLDPSVTLSLSKGDKKTRRRRMAERALAAIDAWGASLESQVLRNSLSGAGVLTQA
jgi:methylenetetrahydrofolate--tRNA-(uracil-5-)-methyltransferase